MLSRRSAPRTATDVAAPARDGYHGFPIKGVPAVTQTATQIARIIAAEIAASPAQVSAAAALLDEGATVPFVARYRKEVTAIPTPTR